MTEITAEEALVGREYVVRNVNTKEVYDLYPDEDIARRIRDDLNRRYGELFEVCHVS